MATDTDRQITDLRTQGEFTKANQVLEISQAYLQQLVSLEQWAAEYNLSAAKFQETVRQWENEFALSVGQVTGSYQGRRRWRRRNTAIVCWPRAAARCSLRA